MSARFFLKKCSSSKFLTLKDGAIVKKNKTMMNKPNKGPCNSWPLVKHGRQKTWTIFATGKTWTMNKLKKN